MNAIITPNTAHIAATIAPTTMLVEGAGKSNIYCFSSINAQDDTQGKTITLTNEEKELLDKWLNDYEREVIISDVMGNQSVRFQNTSVLLMIVFLSANGVGQTDIVAYMYYAKNLRCTLRYTVATVAAERTLLTDENWNEYITLPSGGGNEWIETTDIYDTNLYNAKELCIEVELWGKYSTVYICCPDTLGAHSGKWFEFVIPFAGHTSDTFNVMYDGSALTISYFSSYRIFYRL